MRKSLNWFSYVPRVLKDLGKQKSMTIPGQEQSIRKILDQHSRGMPLPADTQGQYFGDLDVPDFEEMDLTDLMEYTKDLRDDILDMQENLERAAKRKKQMEEADIEQAKKYNDYVKKQMQSQKPDNQEVEKKAP